MTHKKFLILLVYFDYHLLMTNDIYLTMPPRRVKEINQTLKQKEANCITIELLLHENIHI